MSRSPENNPTERIGRLIEEFEELIVVFDQWAHVAGLVLGSDVIARLPPKPRFPTLESEKVRRTLTYSRAIYRDRQRKEMNKIMSAELGKSAMSLKEITYAAEYEPPSEESLQRAAKLLKEKDNES